MELVPFKPFGELSLFRGEMDRLWDRFLRERPMVRTFSEEWAPSVDISETGDNLIVKAELPGLEAKDVNVSLSGDLLTIKGEKKKETEEKDEHHHYIERYSGSFERSFRLPVSIEADKVRAEFDKGVLHIFLPKTQKTKNKEVKIKVK